MSQRVPFCLVHHSKITLFFSLDTQKSDPGGHYYFLCVVVATHSSFMWDRGKMIWHILNGVISDDFFLGLS